LAQFGLVRQPTGQSAEQLLAEMSPEERAGQLFLITFEGAYLKNRPALLRLGHVSGVVLSATMTIP
jgi:hypothetical protein